MLSSSVRRVVPSAVAGTARRSVATSTVSKATKVDGDISSVFPSLSGKTPEPLPPRFGYLKERLLDGRKDAIRASWERLLPALREGVEEIRQTGPDIVPSISFSDLSTGISPAKAAEIKRRGVCVVRGVLPREEALALKQSAREYISANRPRVRAFPPDDPAVYELYWTPSQLRARAHANMLTTQVALQTLWHSSDPNTEISTRHPLTYADRFRIRRPGDGKFALGAHCDGGSIERWEDPEYRSVYNKILEGAWEEYDPYDAKHRVRAQMSLYDGAGGCTMFRMWQGWLSMSDTGPGEGTLKVLPLIRESTAYLLLRPFFSGDRSSISASTFDLSPAFPGSTPGAGQEFNDHTHPHLALAAAMASVPRVQPGDYVAWHCDGLHAVDAQHRGAGDSSVLYIPATPLCRLNARYARDQRAAFLARSPPPDFPGAGGEGESGFVGGLQWETEVGAEGKRAMGLGERGWEVTADMSQGEKKAVAEGNRLLFGESS